MLRRRLLHATAASANALCRWAGGGPRGALSAPSADGFMNPIVLVPARMAASRLPGKPLADIAGEPMIVHVWRRAVEADVGPVAVAAADPEIVQAVTARGGRAVLTDPDLPSGSDR